MCPKKTESSFLNSYAKINLYLDVLGLLPDGYHEIRTIFTAIDVWDVLKYTLTRSKDIQILTNVKAISNRDNLVVRVAHFLQEKYQVKTGVLIELEKQIPLAAGLGGGSSDAASTIHALSDLWDLRLSLNEKYEIAASFGCDIPYFLNYGTVLGTHKGEKLEPLSDFRWDHILLVKPDFGVSSKEAYLNVKYDEDATNIEELIITGKVSYCYNRLQKGVVCNYPVIGEILFEMERCGAEKAIMTGSGSTCLGFFTAQNQMKLAEREFIHKGYWTCCTKTRNQSNAVKLD